MTIPPIATVFVPSITSVHIDGVGLGKFFAELALRAGVGSEAPVWQSASKVMLHARESTRTSRVATTDLAADGNL